jgi:ribosomal protein L29
MDTKDLKEKNTDELKKILSEEREKMRKFRFNMSGTKSKSQKEVVLAKKTIARILTLLTQMKNATK